MVNQPAYNPNDREQLSAGDVPQPRRHRHLRAGLQHQAVRRGRGRSRPASIDDDSIIDTSPGFIKVGATIIEDEHGSLGRDRPRHDAGARAPTSAWRKLALSLEPQQIWSTLTQLGFGQVTTSGFPGRVRRPARPTIRSWRPVGIASMSHGYGLSVTPLQLAQALRHARRARRGAAGVLPARRRRRRRASACSIEHVARDADRTARVGGDCRRAPASVAAIPGYRVVGQDRHGVEGRAAAATRPIKLHGGVRRRRARPRIRDWPRSW